MDQDLRTYLDTVTPVKRRRDAETLVDLFGRITGEPAVLTGTIIGFGRYHYIYDSGREGDSPAASFAARKAATTIYLLEGVDAHADELAKLGPHTTGAGCLYIKDLQQVDMAVLESIVASSYATVTKDLRSDTV